MKPKSPQECLAAIDEHLASLKAHFGEAEPDADDMEIEEKSVGRGRKKRPAPFFKKKGEMEPSEEGEY